ncbi:hypothetical protein [Bradyrhizobium acaciae]|uniref:hypothetical protein n=1 Tax=Bradyrhizobium acaciae TaxID=2683706 RepID=UPI001E5A08B0|nr:hypothetical protein [Bradyrhizobium acaciae]MCC8978080.1 hypothetical protein [Bradyrhizobium acaciae]
MSASLVCSANSAALACDFVSLVQLGAIVSAGGLGPQMHQRAARAFNLVGNRRALADIQDLLNGVAGGRDARQVAYPITTDRQTLIACLYAPPWHFRLLEFTSKRPPLGSTEPHGQP